VKTGYWDKLYQARLSRRRALTAMGGFSASSLLLVTCGGDGEDKSGAGTSKDVSGLVVKAVDEAKNARRGGTFKSRGTFEPSTLDPHQFPNNFYVYHTYSNLWLIKDGVIEYSNGEVEGDLVESWEVSPDKLQITAKLTANARFAPVAPVNGRPVDARDVVASWERHKGSSNQRADFANEVNSSAPIVSMSASDDRTVVIKLAEPNAVVTARLSRATPGSMYIVPKEAADTNVLNLARTSIGSGPYYISDFTPSVGLTLKRNPGFKQDKRDLPYLDQLEYPTVQEYATFLAQFRAGSIYDAVGIRAEDILPTKKDVAALELMQTYYGTRLQRVGFGMASDSLFKDERLRQAWVLTWDRELYLNTVFNADKFREGGLPVDIVNESGLQANTYAGWLLDPKGKDFGTNAKFFSKDVAEAKKLVSAAGFPNGVENFELVYPARSAAVPAAYYDGLDALIGMTQESGLFRWKLNVVQNYFADWFPKYHNQSQGTFSGVTISLSNLAEDPANYLFSYYNSKGTLRQGSDATLDDLTTKAVKEFDNKKRQALVHDIQRYEGGKNFFPRLGGATGFSLAWPALRNREVYRGGTGRAQAIATLFLDPEKAPLKKV
jgi:peptide/nickel transport system substrate-binding protein